MLLDTTRIDVNMGLIAEMLYKTILLHKINLVITYNVRCMSPYNVQ